MSGGIAKERTRDEKSKSMIAEGIREIQALTNDRMNSSKFHGHLVLTFTFFDSAITGYEIDFKKKKKTE